MNAVDPAHKAMCSRSMVEDRMIVPRLQENLLGLLAVSILLLPILELEVSINYFQEIVSK